MKARLMENMILPNLCIGLVLLVCSLFFRLDHVLRRRPERLRSKFRRQGIDGPQPSLFWGNIPEIKRMMSMVTIPKASSNTLEDPLPLDNSSIIFPHFKHWTKQYGKNFFVAMGRVPLLYVTDLDLVRAIKLYISLDLGKPAYLQKDRGPLLGKGVVTSNGAVWSHQRKTIAPELYMDRIKDKLNIVVESASALVKSWESIVESEGGTADIIVDDYVRNFTSRVFSKVLFGSNYSVGSKLLPKCVALIKASEKPTILDGLPFMRYLPTKKNRQMLRLEKQIYSIILDAAKKHDGAAVDGMLKTIIEGAKNGDLGPLTPDQFIVDNCKNLYLAAFEVTAMAAVWGLMLLASHPEWQARARAEVLEVCGGHMPDADMLGKMKVMKMVIQEVLRLYPVVAFVAREALQDVKLGNMIVPRGVNMWVWLLALHHDPELWGPDADKFKPDRFANGISGACKCPQAYMPFGVGARVCPGQSLAILELKVFFAAILSRFSLSLSPNYRHSPYISLLLEPKHGVNLLIRKI
ncbi:cytochrome P450 714C2-like [Cornus florida]|uniref:cytochrome P450 714C2-like n=1 Tax=Cornus florida TaxID=4283 RepID=UPI00289E221B|nr:cytochrome P450 714C2-like [Cornus florida]